MPATPTTDRIAERSLCDIGWKTLTKERSYYPSPDDWRDEVLYFLFLDRFSDGKEYGGFGDATEAPVAGPTAERTTPQFELSTDAWTADRDAWFRAGKTWCGGNLAGLRDKLGYLKRMGVTAVWLSPVFRQVTESDDYHGYGTQNFLDVDPHFGTRDELKELVAAAHQQGIRVILDIILNHGGDVFAYEGNHPYYYHEGNTWPVEGFRLDRHDNGSIDFSAHGVANHEGAWPAGAVWPSDFSSPEAWARKGEIRNWDGFPEYLDGDFLSLKEIHHGDAPKDSSYGWDLQRRIREFRPGITLRHLIEWIGNSFSMGHALSAVGLLPAAPENAR